MPDAPLIILCIALIAVSVCGAVSMYFVCKLVDKVCKLNASNNIWEYQMLDRQKKTLRTDKGDSDENKIGGQVANDGTLSDDALEKLSNKI